MTTRHATWTAVGLSSTFILTVALAACNSSPTSATTTTETTLMDLSLSAASAQAGGTVMGTLTLGSAAPSTGTTVAVSSSNAGVATVPESIVIPPGASNGTFVVSAVAQGSATIMAVVGGSGAKRTATLTVTAVASLASLTLNASTVIGGNPVIARVALDGAAPAAGALVTLTAADPISSPATVMIAPSATSATFTIASRAVGGTIPATISAAYAGRTVSAQFTVTPPSRATAVFGVTGPTETETCTLSNNGLTLNCTFNGSESTAPGTIVAWEWTFGVAKVLAQTTTVPVLSMPAVDCGLIPPPPLPSGQSWFTMPVTLRVRDDAGNVSDVAVHSDTRLFPQGSCGF